MLLSFWIYKNITLIKLIACFTGKGNSLFPNECERENLQKTVMKFEQGRENDKGIIIITTYKQIRNSQSIE
mgnify:CR=1 FL=1